MSALFVASRSLSPSSSKLICSRLTVGWKLRSKSAGVLTAGNRHGLLGSRVAPVRYSQHPSRRRPSWRPLGAAVAGLLATRFAPS